jgi:hypothetical protein
VREDARTKGTRYLSSGRLIVDRVSGSEITARCRGDNAKVYACGYVSGAWYCGCVALTKCSHLVALQLVTLEPNGRSTA